MDSIVTAAAALRAGTTTARELVERAIAAYDRAGATTNAFITFAADRALDEARACDHDAASGLWRGPLHGIPISIKDLIDVEGMPTTAGSRVLPDSPASHDAEVVRRLRAAGAIIIGKTNLHEFAFGTTNEDSAFGAVHHPLDPSRMSGGSSGGSGAAVAAGIGLGSVGTDTGGSIRIPSALCGIVGLKATFGEVPVDGVVPLCASFDHVGPMTRTVGDAAVMWAAMSGASGTLPEAPRRLRLGVPSESFFDLLEDEVHAAWLAAIATLQDRHFAIEPVSIPHAASTPDAYVPIVFREAYAWHREHLARSRDRYTAPVGERLAMGAATAEDDYARAMALRSTLTTEVERALAGVDALALPTMAIVAPSLGTSEIAFGDMRIPIRSVMMRLTQLFDITGHPAITIPLRTSELPVGFQLVGRRGATADLLAAAGMVEQLLA